MSDLLLAPRFRRRFSRRRFALIDSVSRVNDQTKYRKGIFMISIAKVTLKKADVHVTNKIFSILLWC